MSDTVPKPDGGIHYEGQREEQELQLQPQPQPQPQPELHQPAQPQPPLRPQPEPQPQLIVQPQLQAQMGQEYKEVAAIDPKQVNNSAFLATFAALQQAQQEQNLLFIAVTNEMEAREAQLRLCGLFNLEPFTIHVFNDNVDSIFTQ